ncbi:MAG: hypothetical protein IJK29_10890 [Bacteroidales bacterium]|nr:hypothetical protein [Bacteroidales bacterium]
MGRPRKKPHEREARCHTEAWRAVEVRCPFYKGESRNVIVCEGFYVSETVRRCFQAAEKKRRIMEELCCRNFETCPVFQLVYGTYDAKGQKTK